MKHNMLNGTIFSTLAELKVPHVHACECSWWKL